LELAANNLIISINAFGSHTDNISGVIDMSAGSQDFPFYDSAVTVGQQTLLITNKTDNVSNAVPLLGSFTSLFILPELTANSSQITYYRNELDNSIAANTSNLAPAEIIAMTNYLTGVKSELDTRRNHDITFFRESLDLMRDYLFLNRFNVVGNTQYWLLNNLIGTANLQIKLQNSTAANVVSGYK
jgi:hypothetical protein